jgi:hypothetical protein
VKSIPWYGAGFFLPNIVLFFLYNQNVAMNHIRFSHVSILAVILGVLSLLLFFLFERVTKQLEGAFVTLLLFWLFFWTFEAFGDILRLFFRIPRTGLLVFVIAVIAAALYCIRRFKVPFSKALPAFNMLLAVVFMLFAYNLFFGIRNEIVLSMSGQDESYVKTSFVTDNSLPSPDVYWFHMDGMLSFGAMERFFGGSDELYNELEKRGFVINRDAKVSAGATVHSLPLLLSPGFYDNYYGALLNETESLLFGEARSSAIHENMLRHGITFEDDVNPYYEIFHAFRAAGYTIIHSMADSDMPVPPYADRFYARGRLTLNGATDRGFFNGIHNLIDLMVMTTPLSIIKDRFEEIYITEEDIWIPLNDYYEQVDILVENDFFARDNKAREREIYNTVIDSLTVPSPKMAFINIFWTHGSSWYRFTDHDYNRSDPLNNDPFYRNQYINAYNYSVITMLNVIDLVLEENPNALIVLQGDHGIHIHRAQNVLKGSGLSDDELHDLFYSTISAVRIPAQYGGLDEPLDPRNIARLLVNRFVGENYTIR